MSHLIAMSSSVGVYAALALTVTSAWLVLQVRNQMVLNEVRYTVPEKGVILITGASTGIGQHAAFHLAILHSNCIILAGVRKEKDAEDIRNSGFRNLRPIIIDVAIEESCRRAVSEIHSICNEENLLFIGLINNAGVARRYPTELHDISDAKNMFATNFWGAFYLTQLLLPKLRESKGRIINISSISEFVGNPLHSIYVASKYAMGGFSDSLRREVAHFGVSVSVIQPAYVKSAIFATAQDAADKLDTKAVVAPVAVADQTTPVMTTAESVLHTHYAHFFSEKEIKRLDTEIRNDASDPIVVSEAIDHALFAAYPKTRYAVGRVAGLSASMCAWIRWALSDRAADRLITPTP